MHFANCAALAAVLFTIHELKGWIVLNLDLNFEQKWASYSYKIVL